MKLTQEQFDQTRETIKKEIANKTSGNCRVGYALKVSAGDKFENSKHNIEKIANTMIQSGKYIKEPSLQVKDDYNILKNPQYNLSIFNVLTVILNILIGLLLFYLNR